MGAVFGLLLGASGGCGTAPRPVTKIVNGQVVLTRAISPEAYQHVARAFLYEEEQRWEDAARELQRALPFDKEGAELRAHLAVLFIRLGRLDDAAEQVQRSLQIAESVEGRLAAAHLASARRDDKAALANHRAAADLALSDGDWQAIERTHLALASAQLAALDVPAAHESTRALGDVSTDSVRARVELAALAWPLGRLPEAEAALSQALRLEPAELDARLMMAALLVARGRFPEAKAAFREALQRSEDAVEIAEMFLRWMVARGDVAEAADEAARLVPDVVDEGTFETVMRIERAAGRPERVKTAGEQALKKGADPGRVALLVAAALLDGKDRAGAAAQLAKIPASSAHFIESRIRIAEALREGGGASDLDRAMRALDEAAAAQAAPKGRADDAAKATTKTGANAGNKITDNTGDKARDKPDDKVTRLGALGEEAPGQPVAAPSRDWTTDLAVARALADEKRGDAVRAARTLDAALEKDADNARLLLVRAAIEERRGEWRRALGFAEKILAQDARHIEALNFHGFVSAEHDFNLPAAMKRLQVAMALDPGAGGIVDSLGWAYLRAGDLPRATEFLAQADRLEPGDPEIQSHLGELLARKQDLPGAIAMYRQALKSDPSERLARELNSRLRALEAKSAAGR